MTDIMTCMIDVNLFYLLIFSMPGFFFLKGIGYKPQSDYEHFMVSLATGIVFLAFLDLLPKEIIVVEVSLTYPHASGIALSLMGWLMGWTIKCYRKTGDKHSKPRPKTKKTKS